MPDRSPVSQHIDLPEASRTVKGGGNMSAELFDTGDFAAVPQLEVDDITNPSHYGLGETGPEDVSDNYDDPGVVVDLESLPDGDPGM